MAANYGCRLWLNARGACVRDASGTVHGVQGVLIDITRWRTDHGQHLGSLEGEGQRAFEQELLDCLPQMVWSAAADGSSDFFNRRWYAFTGALPGSTFGAGWSDVLHPEDAPKAAAHWLSCVARGADYEIEYRLRNHAGTYLWVLARGVPSRDSGRKVLR